MEGETSIPPRTPSRWRNLKRLLCFRSIPCCGSLWSNHPDHVSLPQEDTDFSVHSQQQQQQQQQPYAEISPDLQCRLRHHQTPQETNLASALAAERQLRAANSIAPIARPLETISLMSLLVEKEKEERKARIKSYEEEEEIDDDKGTGRYCCVCMGRRRLGAAFIPCGHTFCRMCARELWINRGSCPLCNKTIAEILDIF